MLALEQDKATGEQVTLLRRAIERQDRELIDGIFSVREQPSIIHAFACVTYDLHGSHTPPHTINLIHATQATAYLVRRSVELAPGAREAIYETALRLEEWGAALRQFPSLLENPAVRRVFSMQRSPNSVVSDDAEHASQASHRVDLAYDEVRVRGSDTAFPPG